MPGLRQYLEVTSRFKEIKRGINYDSRKIKATIKRFT